MFMAKSSVEIWEDDIAQEWVNDFIYRGFIFDKIDADVRNDPENIEQVVDNVVFTIEVDGEKVELFVFYDLKENRLEACENIEDNLASVSSDRIITEIIALHKIWKSERNKLKKKAVNEKMFNCDQKHFMTDELLNALDCSVWNDLQPDWFQEWFKSVTEGEYFTISHENAEWIISEAKKSLDYSKSILESGDELDTNDYDYLVEHFDQFLYLQRTRTNTKAELIHGIKIMPYRC
jgi:hypothetical protein